MCLISSRTQTAVHVFSRIFRRFKLKNESNDLHRLEEFQSISQSLIASNMCDFAVTQHDCDEPQ